jgi:hypothetical protein
MGYTMFEDSAAARGDRKRRDDPIGPEGRMFAEITRGVHW